MDVSCVELRRASYPDDGALAITPAEWRAFIVSAKAGESGLP